MTTTPAGTTASGKPRKQIVLGAYLAGVNRALTV